MMNLFSHFEDGIFTGAFTYRKPEYMVGDIEDIFDTGLVVVSISPQEILDALCDGEVLGKMDVDQEQVELAFDSLKTWIEINGYQNDMDDDGEVIA